LVINTLILSHAVQAAERAAPGTERAVPAAEREVAAAERETSRTALAATSADCADFAARTAAAAV